MPQPTPTEQTALLLRTLDTQRHHVLGILEGLSEDDLRRPVLPSGWNCVSLVHHLALDVERFWFLRVAAGNADGESDVEDAWQVDPGLRPGEVLDLYRRETERANVVINDTPLDAAPAWWPQDLFGTWRLRDLREIMLHVIAETACHAGHLDAARELIDGRTWLVLTG